MAVRVGRELGKTWRVAEVVEGHGRQDADDDVVVAEVCVEGAVEGEVARVIGYAAVDGAVGDGDVLVG